MSNENDVPHKKCSKCNDIYSLEHFNTTVTHICKKCTRPKSMRTKNKLDTYRGAARSRGLDFNLTLDDLIVPDLCPVFGIPFDRTPHLDRVDNSKGYIKGNVYYISERANRIKGDATIKDLEMIIVYMNVMV